MKFCIEDYDKNEIEKALKSVIKEKQINILESDAFNGPFIYVEFKDQEGRYQGSNFYCENNSNYFIGYLSDQPKNEIDNIIPILAFAVSSVNKDKNAKDLKLSFRELIKNYTETEFSNFCNLFNDYAKKIGQIDIYENDLVPELLEQIINEKKMFQSNIISDINEIPDIRFIPNIEQYNIKPRKPFKEPKPKFERTLGDLDYSEAFEILSKPSKKAGVSDFYYDNEYVEFNSNTCSLLGFNKYSEKIDEMVLDELKLPEGLKYINSHAFYKNNIKKIEMPNSLIGIKEQAFDKCYLLENIKLNEGLKFIKKYAFDGTNIKSIYIPSTADHIEPNAFTNCLYLDKITVSDNNSKYSDMGCNIIYDKETNTLIQGCKTSKIPDETKILEDGCLYNLEDKEITLYNVEKIRGKTFGRNLKKITIKGDMDYIDENAFLYCTDLEEIYIEGKINTELFLNLDNCSKLKNVYVSYLDENSYFCQKYNNIIKPYTLIDKLNMESASFSQMNKSFTEIFNDREK